MVITITHREDRDRAGYAIVVRFHDTRLPVLRHSVASLPALQAWLLQVLGGQSARKRRSRATPGGAYAG